MAGNDHIPRLMRVACAEDFARKRQRQFLESLFQGALLLNRQAELFRQERMTGWNRHYKCGKSGLEVTLIRGYGAERDRAEQELLSVGAHLRFLIGHYGVM
jgi:hypothetical protein